MRHCYAAPSVELPICVAVRYLTLRTGCEKHGRKNPLSFPLFRSGHMSAICTRLGSKGKAGVQRGRKTAGCPSFLPPAAGRGTLPPSADSESPAEVQRKTPCPLGANPLTQFVCPGQPVQRKEPPVRANTLTQFAHPAQPVLKKLPPGQGEPPARFRCPNRHGAAKKSAAHGHLSTCENQIFLRFTL